MQDQPRFFGNRDKFGRSDFAPVLVSPAGQRFETGNLPGLQVDQWLIIELQLVLIEGAAKLGLDRKSTPRLGRLLRLINLRLARCLGLLDRELGIPKQL